MRKAVRKPPRSKPLLLKGGEPRVLASHRTTVAVLYRNTYHALEEEYGGPFPPGGTLSLAVARVALAWVNLVEASQALDAARQARKHGKGRRPSERRIERLARREGLNDDRYKSALADLIEMAKAARESSLAEGFAARVRAIRRAEADGDA